MLQELFAIAMLIVVAGPRLLKRSIWGAVIAGAISYFGQKKKDKQEDKQYDKSLEAQRLEGQQNKDLSRYQLLLADWLDQKNKERNRDSLGVMKQFSSLDPSVQRQPAPARVSDTPPLATLDGSENPSLTGSTYRPNWRELGGE